MGKLIVIEGLDGSGKGTQAALLVKNLEARGLAVRKVSFPDYASDSSALVKMYLSGQFGSDPSDVNAYAASTFYAVDRFASFKRDWGTFYGEGGIVVADRYTTSNAVHQCSKLPREQWDSYLRWLFDFEYRLMGIPAPDAVVYLSVEPAVSQSLMTGATRGTRAGRTFTRETWAICAAAGRPQNTAPKSWAGKKLNAAGTAPCALLRTFRKKFWG